MEIVGDSAWALLLAAADAVLRHGAPIAPRGQATKECQFVHLRLTDPRKRLVPPCSGRRLNPAFAVAEALWVLGGSNEGWIHEFNSRLVEYVGPGAPEGAYGPRIRHWGDGLDQLHEVRQRLQRDPASRRAVVQIFDPAQDHAAEVDVPCTLSFRFFIRDNRLHMHSTMRSQDLWLGFPYDIFTATALQEVLASQLETRLGEYRVSIDSLHLYEPHWLLASELRRPLGPVPNACRSLHLRGSDLDSLIAQCLREPHATLPEGWRDFAHVILAHRLARDGAFPEARRLAEAIPTALGAAMNCYLQAQERYKTANVMTDG